MKESISDSGGGNFILNLLCGDEQQDIVVKNVTMTTTQVPSTQTGGSVGFSASRRMWDHRRRRGSKQRRAAAAAAEKQKQEARLRKKWRLRRRQNEHVSQHLRLAHQRAAAITERFRRLLRAEIEKIVLFANSRLGELSDTIGSLHYSGEDQEEMRKKIPSLADGGMHQLSSSDSDGADSDQTAASSFSGEQDDIILMSRAATVGS